MYQRNYETDPIGDMPDQLIVNGHMFVHVAACPCPRIQAEVERLEKPIERTHPLSSDWLPCAAGPGYWHLNDYRKDQCTICTKNVDDYSGGF